MKLFVAIVNFSIVASIVTSAVLSILDVGRGQEPVSYKYGFRQDSCGVSHFRGAALKDVLKTSFLTQIVIRRYKLYSEMCALLIQTLY